MNERARFLKKFELELFRLFIVLLLFQRSNKSSFIHKNNSLVELTYNIMIIIAELMIVLLH